MENRTKIRIRKPKRHDIICAVCGREATYNYYDAYSCEACKQFFRRAVTERRQYHCRRKLNCDVKVTKCPSCRLDLCLLAGMNPEKVVAIKDPNLGEKYNVQLAERKERAMKHRSTNKIVGNGEAKIKENWSEVTDTDTSEENDYTMALISQKYNGQTSVSKCSDEQMSKFPSSDTVMHDKFQLMRNAILDLAKFEGKLRRFLQNERFIRDEFLDQFQTIGDLLSSQQSLVCNFEQYTEPDPIIVNDLAVATIITNGNFKTRCFMIIMDLISAAELCRSFPIIASLEIEDQACLANYLGIALMEFGTNFDCSTHLNSEIVVKQNGWSPMKTFWNPKGSFYTGDETVRKMTWNIFCLSMAPYNELKLTEEEFLLLRAIIIMNPSVPGLSYRAKCLLQESAERYSHLLLQYLQYARGAVAGARRYAQLLHLAECVYHNAKRHRDFLAYTAMVVEQGQFHDAMPKFLLQMCLDN